MSAPLTIALLTLGDPTRLTGGYLYQQRMAELAPEHGARIEFVSFPDRPFPLPAAATRRVLNLVRALKPGAVVLDSIVAAYLGPWLALRPSALPLVGMLHQPPGGMDQDPFRTAVQRQLDRLAYRRCRRLIVVSPALANAVAAQGFPWARIRVVPPGRDLTQPAVATEGDRAALRQGRRLAVLCVANWQPRKGIHDLLAALARLPPETATLHLVGDDGADPRYAERLRARLGRQDLAYRVVVHGALPPARVAALYAAADVFALPSVQEPYGMVYAEAMSAGLPLVGWRAGNLPYLATDGQEALLAPPGDVPALSSALARLAADEPLRRRLGDAARRRAQTLPTWADSATLFFAAIEEARAEGG